MKQECLPILAVVAVALAGCTTNVPMIESHRGTYQIKVQALQHWDEMAKEVAGETARYPLFGDQAITLDTQTLSTLYSPDNPPTEGTGRTLFGDVFYDMIKSELANTRMHVTDAPDAPLRLTVHTYLVHHGNRFVMNPTSPLGAIGYGADKIVTGRQIGTPESTKSELLVVTLINEGDRIRMAVKQIVYVSPDEEFLYLPATPPNPSVTVEVTN